MIEPFDQLRLPRNLAELASLLSCEVRLEVMSEIVRARTSVTGIAERTELDVPSVSNHLRVLRVAGCATCVKERQKHFYVPGPIVRHRVELGILTITLCARDGNELSVRMAAVAWPSIPISMASGLESVPQGPPSPVVLVGRQPSRSRGL